ncbi:MAG: hypothetical protein QM774_07050 [Gordonia sp. (in: high G+C Gram-positive bacteria)]|uniref:hypothetical protein n=1 Tax=Gordonia sp. (in: high G+C Gram-positive bacteria) TaxID=84139 RepID=UPI0039E23D64
MQRRRESAEHRHHDRLGEGDGQRGDQQHGSRDGDGPGRRRAVVVAEIQPATEERRDRTEDEHDPHQNLLECA